MKTITLNHTAKNHFEAKLLANHAILENIKKHPGIIITVSVPVENGDTVVMWANPRPKH